MQFKTFTFRDRLGNVVSGADVRAYVANTSTQIKVFDEVGSELETPDLVTDANGQSSFAAFNGVYDVVASLGAATFTIQNQLFNDPPVYSTVAAFAADVTAGYTARDGTVVWIGLMTVPDPLGFVANSSSGETGLPAGWLPFGKYSPLHFGAVGDGVTDDTQAFRDMFAAVPENGHCHISGASVSFLIDGLVTAGTQASSSAFHIDKPMTITGDATGQILVKGDGGSFKAMGTRGDLFWLDSSDILIDGLWVDCNTENIFGLEADETTKYYADNQAATATIGVTAFFLYRDDFSVHTSNVVVQNCHITRTSWAAISFSGRKLDLSTNVFADVFDEAGTISDCHMLNNYVEGGQRSTLVFTGGVRHCTMRGNYVLNPHWAGLRFYMMCYDCVMENNHVVYDGDLIDPTKVQSSANSVLWPGSTSLIPRLARFGHPTRLAGTVRYCTARDNELTVVNTDTLDASTVDGVPTRIHFRLETGTVGNVFSGNVLRGVGKVMCEISLAEKFCFKGNILEGVNNSAEYQVAVEFEGDQTDGVFSGNYIEQADRGFTTNSTAPFAAFTNCAISDNVFQDVTADIRIEGIMTNCEVCRNRTDSASISIRLSGTGVKNRVNENNINATTTGILLNGLTDTQVSGNYINGYATTGIDLQGDCTKSFVHANILKGNSATIGISILSASSVSVALINNDLRDAGTTKISDSGTTTVSTGNLT